MPVNITIAVAGLLGQYLGDPPGNAVSMFHDRIVGKLLGS